MQNVLETTAVSMILLMFGAIFDERYNNYVFVLPHFLGFNGVGYVVDNAGGFWLGWQH